MQEILNIYRQQVAREAAEHTAENVKLLEIDRHVAASMLQKAIRRSKPDLALQAAKRLLDLEPQRFWRRLSVTIFEDVGVYDAPLILSVLASAPSKDHKGANWKTIQYLIERLCDTPKTQIANHLIHLAMFDETEVEAMQGFELASIDEAFKWVLNKKATLAQKARALRLLSGLECGRKGQPIPHWEYDLERILTALESYLDSIELSLIMREGIRLTHSPLVLSAILERKAHRAKAVPEVLSDVMPPAVLYDGIPSWVYDQHTRIGKTALTRAVVECPNIVHAVSHVIGHRQKVRCLSSAHFEYEAACLEKRMQFETQIQYWKRVREVGAFRNYEVAATILRALKADWKQFQDLVLQVIKADYRNSGK